MCSMGFKRCLSPSPIIFCDLILWIVSFKFWIFYPQYLIYFSVRILWKKLECSVVSLSLTLSLSSLPKSPQAMGSSDGTIALYQLIFGTVHGLYKDRYAYRLVCNSFFFTLQWFIFFGINIQRLIYWDDSCFFFMRKN